MEINGQVAVITGGGSGIGAETARYLAKAGAKVVLLDNNLKNAQTIAQEIKGFAFECDVSDAKNTEQVFKQLLEQVGSPRVCINCAGIAPANRIVGRNGPMPLSEFERAVSVNLIGTFNVLRLAAAAMSQLDSIGESRERGVIINTASIAAFEGQIGQAAYSASKGGVVALTLPAARELARFGIRVVAIAPGLIETPLLLQLPQELRDNLLSDIPFPKRFGEPSEYAKLALHIIDNPLLNGELIRLDGALRMR